SSAASLSSWRYDVSMFFTRNHSCIALLLATLALGGASGQITRSGNPVLAGWYADPEARIFDGEYWIYPTYSAPYGEQTFLDAFSSNDLVTWTKHPRVLD